MVAALLYPEAVPREEAVRVERTGIGVNLLMQLLVAGIVVTLPAMRPLTYTPEQAAHIRPGMSRQAVETHLGQPSRLEGHVFVPVQVFRDGEYFVDDIMFVSTFFPAGPGLPRHTLHSRQEECWTDWNGDGRHWSLWLGNTCSIVVIYNQADRVEKVYALRTTTTPGDLWEQLKWRVGELLK